MPAALSAPWTSQAAWRRSLLIVLKLPSFYQIKKTLLYPRTLYMRRKESLEPGFIRSALELHYYRPAFYQWLLARSVNEYLLHEADIDQSSIVLDVGAYNGDWSRGIGDLYNATIFAFEPDPRNFKQLIKNTQNIPRFSSHEYGLGSTTETVQMTMELMGSTVTSDAKNLSKTPSANVEIRDIFEVWQTLGLERVGLMKINIEGGEFSLLERMIETDLVEHVDCYLIQFHEWHPDAYRRRRQIRAALKKTHRLDWDYHFIWEKWVRH